MLQGIPKISVYIITYNQEDVIERTLGSILAQIDYVYEVCVSDDHSTDNTWEILQEYDKKYPGLFRLNRNNPNLGIFENTEKVWTMPTGDIVHDLAGDDSVGEGWFKKVIEYIQDNHIDWENELFCIYGDYRCIYPNGDSVVHRQSAVEKYNDVFRLSLRGVINGRSCCYSRRILNRFKKVSQGRSHIAENAQDRQLQIFTEKSYYIESVGNIYYAMRGISAHIDEEKKKERMEIWPYSIKCFNALGINIKKKDLLYVQHRMAYQEYHYWGRKMKVLLSFWYFCRSFDFKIFLVSDTIRSVLFAIRRRLPHKHVINMN